MSGQRHHQTLIFGLQALRRRVERDAQLLGGALCVAADQLSHQVATVERVLTATRVRHLLADEVGMGKTVQAIMILNALRLQRKELRVLVLVPPTLVQQWRDELRARGHEAPIEEAVEDPDAERRTRLAWPGKLSLQELDPRRFDLIIVDELQRLRQDFQQRLVQISSKIEHLLILTATPELANPQRAYELFQLLEPAKVELAKLQYPDEDVLDVLRDHEHAVVAAVNEEASWEALPGGQPPTSAEIAVVANAHAALRRVVRSRRADYEQYFPCRKTRIELVEPLEHEVERQQLMWRYLMQLEDMTREFEPYLLAQRVARSQDSLRQRVTYLRGHGHERGEILAKVVPLLDPALGDSRFDALIDILQRIWRAEAGAKVMVAAGDNLTVDALFDRVPAVLSKPGSRGGEALEVARLRNQSKVPDDMTDPEDVLAQEAYRFSEGTAQLLLAAETGSTGQNLQAARHLVFYALPWSPQELEQWIGRIDRLGCSRTYGRSARRRQSVVIHLIVQRGLVDERVLRVLERTGILHHSVSLSGEMVEEIDAAIKAAALGREEAAWGRAGEAAAAIAEVGELAQLELPLSEALAWTSQLAQKRWESLVRTPALPPYPVVVRTDKESALRHLEPGEKGGEDKRKKGMAVEAAMSDWMWAMKAAGVYRLWFDRKARMVSLRYRSADRRVGAATELTPVPLDEDLIPRPWKRSVGFRVFRCDLTNPPQREWTDSNGEKRVLYFLDHGSPLHESLVGGWLHELQGRGEADPEKLTYAFQIKDVEQHGLGEVDGHLLCAKVAVIHPRLELDPVDTLYGENGVEYEADVRFLQQQLPPRLLLTGYSAGPAGGVTALSEPILHALLAPQVRAGRLVEVGDVNRLPQSFANRVEQLLGKAADKLKVEAREGWSPRLPAARVAVAERTWQLRVEAANELELLLAKQALVEGDLRELNAALKGDDSLRKKLRPMQVRRARECAELEAAEVSTRERLVARREALTEALRRATSPTVVSICQVVVVVGKVS